MLVHRNASSRNISLFQQRGQWLAGTTDRQTAVVWQGGVRKIIQTCRKNQWLLLIMRHTTMYGLKTVAANAKWRQRQFRAFWDRKLSLTPLQAEFRVLQREKTYRTDPMLNTWGRVALRLFVRISIPAQLKLLGIQCNVLLDPKMCMWNFLQAIRTNEPMPDYVSNNRWVACKVTWRSLFEKAQ